MNLQHVDITSGIFWCVFLFMYSVEKPIDFWYVEKLKKTGISYECQTLLIVSLGIILASLLTIYFQLFLRAVPLNIPDSVRPPFD